MTKPKPANLALSISGADLVAALAQIGAAVDHQPLRSSARARIMRETFNGSDASGAWDWRMTYDLMQAAANQVLLRGGRQRCSKTACLTAVADRGMIDGLKVFGCITEIIAFQLRVFLPHGGGIDTLGILSRLVGTGSDAAQDVASVAAE